MDHNAVTSSRDHTLPACINRLPVMGRKEAASRKYAEAVGLYATTTLPLREIALRCGVTPAGLSAHISHHHRNLLLSRYGLDPGDPSLQTVRVKPPKGQSLQTHLKYRDAVEACDDMAYVEYNVSQVAAMFGLGGTALAAQLKVHYPDIIPARERQRQRLGLADNTHRGPRARSVETYARALEMYRDTDMTIPEVAETCGVPQGGLTQFLRFYHKDILACKSARRRAARRDAGLRRPGQLSGTGDLYGPRQATEALYAEALRLYRDTPLTIAEIVEKTGVPDAGFRGYLHQWHRGEKLRRRGFGWDGESAPDLRGTPRYLKSTAAKYAPAIASLRERPRAVSAVAAEFGLNADVFREYLREHEPELASARGMTRDAGGRLVRRSSAEKYADAIREYATSAEPLKSIAERHGLVYNSLLGYVTRNCPAERESHRRLAEAKATPA